MVLSEKHEVSDMVRIRLQMQVVSIAFMKKKLLPQESPRYGRKRLDMAKQLACTVFRSNSGPKRLSEDWGMPRESKGGWMVRHLRGRIPAAGFDRAGNAARQLPLLSPGGLGGFSLWPVSDRTGQDRTGIAARPPS